MDLTFIQYRNLIKKAIDGCKSNLKTFVINLNKTKDLTEDEKKEIEDIITQGMQWESKKRMLSLLELKNQNGVELFEILVPKKEELYFDAKVSEQISDLIFILQNGEKLRKYNQTDNICVLLTGKSGTGKTALVKNIATITNKNMIIVALSSVISSYLGDTSKELKRIFDYALDHECILFLDEFDTLGKMRGDEKDVSEMSRVVNTLIQLIDNFKVKGGNLFCATNFKEIIDTALLRRFNYIVDVPLPSDKQIYEIVKSHLESCHIEVTNVDNIVGLFSGKSGATIKNEINKLIINNIKNNKEIICGNLFKVKNE